MTSTQTGTEAARQTASTAADEAKHLGSMGGEEVQKVAAEAKSQVRSLWDETGSQVHDQTTHQRDRLVGTLQTLSLDLEDMASRSDGSGLATELAREAARRARDLSGRLDGREPGQMLDDVRSFARRRPGLFLAGALAAGIVAGRIARGAQAATGSGATSAGDLETATGGGPGVATTPPPFDTGVPPVAPPYPEGARVGYPAPDPILAGEDVSQESLPAERPQEVGGARTGSMHGDTP